jgi:predicted phosphodiesterase
MLWTAKQLKTAKTILGRFQRNRFQDALDAISEAVDREVTGSALRSAFLRESLGPPTSFMREAEAKAEAEEEDVETIGSDDVPGEEDESSSILQPSPLLQKFIGLTKKGPIDFHVLCDKLNLPPSKAQKVIDEAAKLGVKVHVEHNHVGIRLPEPNDQLRSIGVTPVVGERQKVAVISDTHLGSKYCLREQLVEFIHYAYAQGVREILHPGDVLDGCYRHGMWEVSHSGLDEQARDLLEVLPKLPGLSYHCITGNHDFTFTEQIGADVGNFLSNYFKENGREDLHFYGNRGAFIKIRGAVVHLWHPKSGAGYARSYAIQKHIEKYSSGEKPNILLTGHWHVFCHVYERGVHGIACPTFQGGGSAFSKSLGGAPAIGGLILSWDVTKDGTLRSFVLEKRSYFEFEQPRSVGDEMGDGIPVPVRVSKSR